MLIGQGYDAHRFAPGRELVLGGVKVDHDQGMLAHSDGDVVIHALCDAILGAAGLGDIGRHFPDTDAQYKNADSRLLLRQVMKLISLDGLRVHNTDITIVAQQPKLAPHMEAMRVCLAEDLQLAPKRVNLKATTTEGMGFAGRGEGIATYAVVLLEE